MHIFCLVGVGYCAVTVSYFVSFYYNTIMCWSLHFTISSFKSPLPWTSCNNSWNSKQCHSKEGSDDYLLDTDYENVTSITTMMFEPGGGPADGNGENFTLSHDAPHRGVRPENATSPASEYFR